MSLCRRPLIACRSTMPGRIIFWAAPLLVRLALFNIVWESMATLVGNSLILPPPEEIGASPAHPLDNVIAMGTLAGNIGISLVRVLCGYAAAVLLGVPLGVADGRSCRSASPAQSFSGAMFRPIPPLGLGTAGAGPGSASEAWQRPWACREANYIIILIT